MADESEQPTQLIQGPPMPPSGGTATLEPREPRLAEGGGAGAPPNYPPTGYGGDGNGSGGPGDGEEPGDKRIALLAAVAGILLVIVLFLVFKPSDDPAPVASSTPTPTTQPAPAEPSTPATTPATPPATTPAQGADDDKDSGAGSGGAAIGGDDSASVPQLGGAEVVKIEASQGDTVRFQVTNSADEAQEVHVHGYDLSYDVQPGETRTISFPAKLTGRFEIEFEATATQIGDLTVNP